MIVTALLVSHNGQRWIPSLLEALSAQTRRVDRIVAVDTGSADDSPALLAQAIGAAPIGLPGDTAFGAAVEAGLASLPPAVPGEWIWLLHDDSAPAPSCLAELCQVAANSEDSVAAVGPKLREWPASHRLLEVGITVTGTGRRETGLESGEPDQGQYDQVDRVLAVNTAGMLVRRDVLEYFGFAPELPLFANDLDFGWRLAARSLQIHVVPAAVMFHAEAAYRGRRHAELAKNHRRDARAAEMFVVLANGSRRLHAVRLVRMFVSGLLRAFGFSLIRSFSRAKAELDALRIVYGSPRANHRARQQRQAAATAHHHELHGLLAPVWMPWRHGLDLVIDFVRVVYAIAADAARARLDAESAKGPLSRRILSSPTSYVLALVFLAALIAEHSLLGPGPLAGGALLQAPGGPGHWWSLWWSSWHWVGPGSSAAGPPYSLPMAVVSTIGFGQPGLILWLIFGMGVPIAAVGAWLFAGRLSVGPWARAWLCVTYALVPVALGAISGGHLGTMAVAILLPWIARAMVGLTSESAEQRERSVWRVVLIGGLAACFAPILALLLVVFVFVAPYLGVRGLRLRDRIAIGLGPWLLMLPWLVSALRHPSVLLVEAGAADSPSLHLGAFDQMVGTLPGPSHVSVWLLLGVPLAAAAALVRPSTRPLVMRCWFVAAGAALITAVYVFVDLDLPGRAHVVPYLGVPLLIQMSALQLAVVCATPALRQSMLGTSFGYRQVLVAGVTLFALVAPVAGVVSWLSHGSQGDLRGDGSGVSAVAPPQYIADLASTAPSSHNQATLILRGGGSAPNSRVVSYLVQRSSAVLGDEALLMLTPQRVDVRDAITNVLASRPADAARTLAAAGIAYVYAPSPVSSQVAGAFDSAPGFTNSSTPDPATRAWRIDLAGPQTGLAKVGTVTSTLHWLAMSVQLVALLAVIVLAAPAVAGARRTEVSR